MNDISTLKTRLDDLAARYRAELERDTRKLIALARLIDAEMAVREMEDRRHEQT